MSAANPLHLAISTVLRGAGGGQPKQRQPVESPDSLRSIAYARIVDLVSEGEIFGFADQANPLSCVFFNETPVANADGSLNFKNVQIDSRVGTQAQDYLPNFDGVESENLVNVELRYDTPWTRAIANLNLNAIRIRLAVPILTKTNTSNGDTGGSSISYRIELSTDGGSYQPLITTAITGKTTTKYVRSHRINLPTATTGWTVRVVRLTADSTSSSLQNTSFVEAFTEIIDAKLRMPMSAMVSTIVDAEQFNNIPARAFHLKGRLIRVPSNYDPDTRVYTGVWDGTFQTRWSNNPAWVFYDMALNSRYGLGHLLTPDLVDKWALYKIAQYCDELVDDGFGGQEPRFTCNVYLQAQNDALRVMQDLATVFRGIIYANGGAVTAVGDMPEDPVYTYTPANVIDGKFTYSGSARKVRHTVALVSWSDMSDFGRAKVEYVDDPEGIARYGIQQTELIAVGCTSRGQARRFGRYLLATERYETDTVAFGVGLDGTIAAPGKIVNVADPLRAGERRGGRIKAAGVNYVDVDFMSATASAGDTLVITLPTGVTERLEIQSIVGARITTTANFTAVPVTQSIWAIDSGENPLQTFRVLSVAEASERKGYMITALKHVPGKFAYADSGEPIEVPPVNAPWNLISAPTGLVISAQDVVDTNVVMKVVNLSWNPVADATAYEVQWRQNDGSWINLGKAGTVNIDIPGVKPGPFEVQVTAINAMGVRSIAAFGGPYDVTEVAEPPGFVDTLNASIAAALTTANNAQAVADGVIDTFWQPTPPATAKDGDVWYDTANGNLIHRYVSGSWVEAQDDEIALAIFAASTAQATADGKVKLFVGSTPPVSGYQLNDLWFNTTLKATFRYNGTDWSTAVADVTLDQLGGNGINLVPDQYSYYESATLPTGYTGANAALAIVAGGKVSPNSLRLTAGSALTYAYFDYTGISAPQFPRTAGKKYIVSAWVMCATAAIPVNDVHMYMRGKPSDIAASTATGNGIIPANTWARVSAIVDTAPITSTDNKLTAFVLFNNTVNGRQYFVDGLMVEEALGTLNKASAYVRGTAGGVALSALIAAQSAQATADGAIDIYHQASPPAIGGVNAKIGDYWQDTDDGKWYYCNGSSWVDATDSRLPQVITDLQTTNGVVSTKTRLFYQETQPTATALGDMWFKPSENVTRYWNGTGWSLQADNSMATQAASSLVRNGGFEAGVLEWSMDAGFYHQVGGGANIVGTAGLVKGPGAAATSYSARNTTPFAASPDEYVTISAFVQKIGGAANGNVYLDAWFLKPDGTWNGSANVTNYSAATPITGSDWRQLFGTVRVPAGTGLMHVVLSTYDHTSGYWSFDQVRAAKKDDSNLAVGNNLVPNSTFGGENGDLSPWAAGWNPNGAVVTFKNQRVAWTYGPPYKPPAGAGGRRVEFRQAGTTTGSPGVVDWSATHKMRVKPNQRYEMYCWAAPYRCAMQLVVAWYDSTGAYIIEAGTAWSADNAGAGELPNKGVQVGAFTTAPANAAYASIFFRKSNTTSGADSVVFIEQPFFGEARANQVEFSAYTDGPLWSADEVNYGAVSSPISNDDIFAVSLARRLGLRVKGSRHTLGGARNTRTSLVVGTPSVRTATALTATSAGVVSVNAHTLEVNGESIAYAAVASAVTGLTQNVTYLIYTIDPYLDGGTRTYFATTSTLSVQQAAEGYVAMGNVTIPTSGSAGGGGGGGGIDPCVAIDMHMPNGIYAHQVEEAEQIACWDESDEPGVEYVPVESNYPVDLVECIRIESESGAAVVASHCTPMTLRNHTITYMPEMLGEEVLVNRNGELKWERVVKLEWVGKRTVAKIKVHQRCYFAGETADATIATHNPTYKP